MILGGLTRRDLVALDLRAAAERAGRNVERKNGLYIVKASSGIELVAPFGGVVDDVA